MMRWFILASLAASAAAFTPLTSSPLVRAPRLDTASRSRSTDGSFQTVPQRTRTMTMLEPVSPGGFNSAGKPPIEIRGFSLAKAILTVGVGLTFTSFAEYFLTEGSGGLSSLGFIYGIPVTLIGFSLQYAELPPAGMQATQAAEALFDSKATQTMQDIKSDVTRHRYGDEAHLDTTVKALGLVLPQKAYPQLQYLEIEQEDGNEVAMTMVFQSLDTPYRMWAEEERVRKYNTFFGPGCWAQVVKISAEEKLVGIKLTTGTPPPAPAPAAAVAAEEAA